MRNAGREGGRFKTATISRTLARPTSNQLHRERCRELLRTSPQHEPSRLVRGGIPTNWATNWGQTPSTSLGGVPFLALRVKAACGAWLMRLMAESV